MPHSIPNPFRAGDSLLSQAGSEIDILNVDITLVINASHSMRSLLSRLAGQTAALYVSLVNGLDALRQSRLRSVRVRFIGFRDMYMDEQAFVCSDFFTLPHEASRLDAFIRNLQTPDTGMDRKSAMEALCIAMSGPWRQGGGENRHIVALITDCDAYPLEDPMRRIDSEYALRLQPHLPRQSASVPERLDQLCRLWRDGTGGMRNWSHRLLIITSADNPWDCLTGWDEATIVRLRENQLHALDTDALAGALLPLI